MSDNIVARLKILLGIDSAEVTTGAKKAEREVQKMSKGISGWTKLATVALGAMGGALTVGTIVSVTKRALEFTAAIKDQAREAGVSTKALQEYRWAALQAGLSNEQLADGFKDMTLKIGEAVNGGKSAVAIFKDAGVSIRDANGEVRSAADILPELADAYNKLGSEAEKSSFAARIFGEDNGPKMKALLDQGSAGMMSYRQAANELGMVISDVNIKKAEEAERKMAALNRVLSVNIATFIDKNADKITRLVNKLLELAGAAIEAAAAWERWQNSPGGPNAQAENARIRNPGSTGSTFAIRPAADEPMTTRKGQTTGSTMFGLIRYGTADRRIRLPKGGRGGGRSFGSDRLNAIGGSAFGGNDLSRFVPGLGASDWIKAASASGVLKDNSAAVEIIMKRLAVEFGQDQWKMMSAAAKGMGDEAMRAQRILDRLYPDKARSREYFIELQDLEAAHRAGAISADQLADAQEKLRAEFEADAAALFKVNEAVARYVNSAKDAAVKSEAVNERIAVSFEESAQRAISAIDRLSWAVSGGGFLDILSAVIGLGVDLGLFNGNKSATSIKVSNGGGVKAGAKTPGFATGGSMILGGRSGIDRNLLSLNGQALAWTSAGERMTISPRNDRALDGGTSVQRLEIYDTTGLFRFRVSQQILETAPAIAQAGAAGGVAQVRRINSRRLA